VAIGHLSGSGTKY